MKLTTNQTMQYKLATWALRPVAQQPREAVKRPTKAQAAQNHQTALTQLQKAFGGK